MSRIPGLSRKLRASNCSALMVGLSAAFGFAAPAEAANPTPYTVDHMLAVESFGSIRFTPDGHALVFERVGPFDRQATFGRASIVGQLRTKLYVADLTSDEAARPLFAQNPDEGYRLDGISPDGTRVAFSHVSNEGLKAGTFRFADEAVTLFPAPSAWDPETEPAWIEGSLVREMLEPGEADLLVGLEQESAERTAELWRTRNAGASPTSRRIGSGRFATRSAARGSLKLLDGEVGTARVIASGAFSGAFLSADGDALAALRESPLAIAAGERIEHGANIGGVQRELLVFRIGSEGPTGDAIQPCVGCDVLASSLNWSSRSPLLSFVARQAEDGWDEAAYHVYDHRTGETRAVELGGLIPHAGRSGLRLDIRSAWLGDRLIVYARPPSGNEGEPRPDWHVAGPTPRNLTASFADPSPQLIGLTEDHLVLLHEGDVWRVDLEGRRTNLTEEIVEPVQEWRAPMVYSNLPLVDRRPAGQVVVQIPSETVGTPDRLLIVEVRTGRVSAFAGPSHESAFVAVDAERGLAAVTDRSAVETRLLVIAADGSRREIMSLNAHLEGVVGGTPVRIDHLGPSGDRRISWMLLPPGYRSGDRVPTVVNIYPGWVGRDGWTRSRLDQMAPLNDHILAAAGYAVLYPSLPVRYELVPRDPLTGLAEEVLSAVDAAVSAGYANPDQLAVQGQSLGGYATGAIVGLTDRFKTAVAQAGLYNLISSYGQFDIRQRLDHDRRGLDLFGASILETSQGGMGSPPWDDIERYWRNSPLKLVENIATPIMIMHGDRDIVSTTQAEEFFTALTRLGKDAVFVRYYGEGHIYNSPANIRDMWERVIGWYGETLGPPYRPVSD